MKAKILFYFFWSKEKLSTLDLAIILISAFIILATIAFVFISIFRRVIRASRFKKLDKLRRFYLEKLKDVVYSGKIEDDIVKQFVARPGSLEFQAIEDSLFKLMEKKKYEPEVKEVFKKLGYIDYYERRLEKRNRVLKAMAIDKLGRMKSVESIGKIAKELKSDRPEIINVSIRALANIGTSESLEAILSHLPLLYEKWLVTRKAVENAILKYGQEAIPTLVNYLSKIDNPKIIAIILNILSHLKSEEACPMALNFLSHENPEVRAKALKILEASSPRLNLKAIKNIISLLKDPVWFVRLWALRVLQKIEDHRVQYALASALFDAQWQVRDEAARALAKMGDCSLDIFLNAFHYDDRYVQETICEEIERTGFINQLLNNLEDGNGEKYKKSKEILTRMHVLNYSTPFLEYLKKGQDEKIKEEIRAILESRPQP